MAALSFLHVADLHLGFQQYNLEERFEDFGRAFFQAVDEAVARKVDYLLIAGDLFNKRTINSRTLDQAVAGLDRLRRAGIETVAIEGNHDKAPYGDRDSWMWFLNRQGYLNLLTPFYEEGRMVLKPWDEDRREGTVLVRRGVRFVGLGYLGAMVDQRVRELAGLLPPSDAFTVLLLHGAVDRMMHFGGVRRESLEALRGLVDYVALGHIHGRYEIGGWIFNPGAPECWDLSEHRAEKGFYLVRVEEGSKVPAAVHIASRRRPVVEVAVDASGAADPDQAVERALEAVRGAMANRAPATGGGGGTGAEQLNLFAWVEEVSAAAAPGETVGAGEAHPAEGDRCGRPLVRVNLGGTVPFNPVQMDVRRLEERIVGECGALFAEIVNDAVMEGDDPAIPGEAAELDREELEHRVLHHLIAQAGRYDRWAEELVRLARTVKAQVIAGASEESVAMLIEALARKLVEEER
ncbi:MAG: exonuclease SbcCD subunit D [Alicyclobacillaceae bacterium]|nr:exonuclease SbcCD subunit D [Alicyclobacillaceae bacterium]